MKTNTQFQKTITRYRNEYYKNRKGKCDSLTIRLPKGLKGPLKNQAKEKGMPMNALVVDLIENFLHNNRSYVPKKISNGDLRFLKNELLSIERTLSRVVQDAFYALKERETTVHLNVGNLLFNDYQAIYILITDLEESITDTLQIWELINEIRYKINDVINASYSTKVEFMTSREELTALESQYNRLNQSVINVMEIIKNFENKN